MERASRFVEVFVVPSWEEHLRQHHERQTGIDRQYREQVAVLSDPPPQRGVPTMKIALKEKQRIPAACKEMPMFKKQKKGRTTSIRSDTGLLILRLMVGGLLAGHGTQKLFGWFGGPGLQGTAGWLESLGLQPGMPWAIGASASEFGGGMLTVLGFFHPFGSLGMLGSMVMATVKGHWGKPIWATQGGAELPVVYMAAALALIFTGPGRFSLDYAFGIRLPRELIIFAANVEAILLAIGIMKSQFPPRASSDRAAMGSDGK